jgi:hypothetical protein
MRPPLLRSKVVKHYMLVVCVGGTLLGLSLTCSGQSCQPYWTRTSASVDGMAVHDNSLRVFDDGAGTKLYASGVIRYVGDPTPRTGVFRWDGWSWEVLSAGLPNGAQEYGPWLRVLDEGQGPQLYAVGSHIPEGGPPRVSWVARWAGSQWVPANPEWYNRDLGITAWTSADLGVGIRVFGIRHAAQGTVGELIEWIGGTWVSRGSSNGSIYEAILYDDGTGPGLYVSGSFNQIGGIAARGIARWNGSQWFSLGTGIAFTVREMAIYNDGRGPALYVVGGGTKAGGMPVSNIARWDGSTWEDVGGGTGSCVGCPSTLYAVEVFDDGTGPGLYVGGYMSSAGCVPASGIARWDGRTWSPLGSGVAGFYLEEFTAYNDPLRGPSLFVANTSNLPTHVGGGYAPGIAQWVGCPNCYANCDLSAAAPTLNVADFTCFLRKYALRDPYANCNVDAAIDIADFACFLQRFAAGCP